MRESASAIRPGDTLLVLTPQVHDTTDGRLSNSNGCRWVAGGHEVSRLVTSTLVTSTYRSSAPQQQFGRHSGCIIVHVHVRGEDIDSTLSGSTELCDTEGATHKPQFSIRTILPPHTELPCVARPQPKYEHTQCAITPQGAGGWAREMQSTKPGALHLGARAGLVSSFKSGCGEMEERRRAASPKSAVGSRLLSYPRSSTLP